MKQQNPVNTFEITQKNNKNEHSTIIIDHRIVAAWPRISVTIKRNLFGGTTFKRSRTLGLLVSQ